MAEVRAAKESEALTNIRLYDYFPREQLHASLSMADVHLISLRREMTGIVVPSKLYGAMASGRPTLFVGPEHCETADSIRHADCGITIRLGDSEGLVETLNKLAADPDLRDAMGRNGRAAFLATFERSACCAQWSGVIGEMIPAPRRQQASVLRQVGAPVASGAV